MVKASNVASGVIHDHRKLSDVLLHDVTNYIYFFTPLILAYNFGWWVSQKKKTLLSKK
jgi:hypothetical protein